MGDNTIPPHYSREMSRYEPPIPVKEKEKEEALEMINGGSKGSKSEKQVEGDTDLSWDPKPSRVPRPGVKDEQSPVKICPKHRGNHDEKDCSKFQYQEEREEIIPPQSVKQSLQTDNNGAKVKEKWEPGKRDSVINKDTKKWVNSLKKKKKSRKRGSL